MIRVFYHANCMDGNGAAFAAYSKFGPISQEPEQFPPSHYTPVQYGTPPPQLTGGEDLYILDFSYSWPELRELAKVAGSVTVLDHHLTALQRLAPKAWEQKQTKASIREGNISIHIDLDKSGAILAWEHFFPTETAPELLQHIADRDLWQFKMKDTKEIILGLSLYEDWREWDDFCYCRACLVKLRDDGAAVMAFLKKESEKIVKTKPIFWKYTGDTVPVYNLPGFMISDTLALALEKYPECPYAVAFFDLPDKRVYGLRSRSNEPVDVSEIAKRWGGGGHKSAAGFSVPFETGAEK